MKFVITGADRQSGEDVELRIDATNEADARAKASRRGILVAKCQPLATAEGFSGAEVAQPVSYGRVQRLWKHTFFQRRRNLIAAGTALVAAVLVPAFLLTFRASDEAIKAQKEAADRAVAASERMIRDAERSLEMTRRVDADMKRMRAESGFDPLAAGASAWTPDRSKPQTKNDAISADPYISGLLDQYPDLRGLVIRGDQGLEFKLTRMVAAGLMTPNDTRYVRDFSQRLRSFGE